MASDDGGGGLGPDEWRWVLIPMSDIGGDVLAKLLLAQEFRRTEGLLGEDAEEAFDLSHEALVGV